MHTKNLTCADLAEIYCKLNSWEWDGRLGEKPKEFDAMGMDEKHGIVWPLILQIRMLVPEYELDKEWQKRNNGVISQGKQAFDEWFSIHKVKTTLDEWEALNESRKVRCKDAKEPDRNVLDKRCKAGKHLFARFFLRFRKHFNAK